MQIVKPTTAAMLLALLTATSTIRAQDDSQADRVNVASLVIKGDYPESSGQTGLFGEIEQNLRETIRRLDTAADDEKISAVLLKVRGISLGRGKLDEMRQAIGRVREAGKRVIADMESASTADYLIAAAWRRNCHARVGRDHAAGRAGRGHLLQRPVRQARHQRPR